jgi:hypothetical protein
VNHAFRIFRFPNYYYDPTAVGPVIGIVIQSPAAEAGLFFWTEFRKSMHKYALNWVLFEHNQLKNAHD